MESLNPSQAEFQCNISTGSIGILNANDDTRICWPFHADQPMAAEHLTRNLNVAFHLIEVRTGMGLQPLHSGRVPRGTRAAVGAEIREILDQCRGEVGRKKRKNAHRMKGELSKAWSEGGSAQVAMHAFLMKY